ncbi:MAG: protein kinase [Legionella sp.]|uniref:protein kinase n=1 Tax=Legionella sp. TaxID=459 RepID=UPI0039E3DECA
MTVYFHYTVQEKESGSNIILNKPILENTETVMINATIERLKKLKHPSILIFNKFTQRKEKHQYDVGVVKVDFDMEFCKNQTLVDILDNLTEKKILEISLTLISGLIYYESQNLFPQLRLDSIMVCENDKVKILDESIIHLGQYLTPEKPPYVEATLSENKSKLINWLGLAPELVAVKPKYTSHSALFSFGTILLQMFKGAQEFNMVSNEQIKEAIDNTIENNRPIPKNCPDHWKNIIKCCLQTKPEARPTLTEVWNMLIALKPDVPKSLKAYKAERTQKAEARNSSNPYGAFAVNKKQNEPADNYKNERSWCLLS